MSEMESKIERLPKWAQDHIRDLERQRNAAIRTLNETLDKQTPGPFFYDDMPCTGEGGADGPVFKRIYIQAGWRIQCEHAGVLLSITVPPDGRKEIRLQWMTPEMSSRDIALIPESYCAARLVAKEGMR